MAWDPQNAFPGIGTARAGITSSGSTWLDRDRKNNQFSKETWASESVSTIQEVCAVPFGIMNLIPWRIEELVSMGGKRFEVLLGDLGPNPKGMKHLHIYMPGTVLKRIPIGHKDTNRIE